MKNTITIITMIGLVMVMTGCMSSKNVHYTSLEDRTPEIIESLNGAGYTRQEITDILLSINENRPDIFIKQEIKDTNKKYKSHSLPIEVPLIK